jgi:DNA-binding transcriptional MerR regulator
VLKIGHFSRLAGVTIKTLRFYDDAGLFRPVYVDPVSGYRFYVTSQLPTLQRIRLLRDLGCTVAEVRELAPALDSPDCVRKLVALRKRLIVRVALDEQRLKEIDRLLQRYPEPASDYYKWPVVERRVAPVPVLSIRDRIRTFGIHVERMFEDAELQVARRGRRAPLSPFLLLHDMEYRDKHIDVEVCVPISPESLTACSGSVVDGVDRAACARFSGSYDQAPRLYEAIVDRMGSEGARIAGAVREVYIRFGANQCGYTLPRRMLANSVGEYQTELQIPVRPPGEQRL